MKLTPEESARLRSLTAEFNRAGGRGVDLAEEIDLLRAKRAGRSYAELMAKAERAFGPNCMAELNEDDELVITTGWRQLNPITDQDVYVRSDTIDPTVEVGL